MSSLHVLQALLDTLWEEYLERVSYARSYVELIESKGGTIVNDHIALRTLNTKTGNQPAGIEALSRIIIPLGYVPKKEYHFPDKHLLAWHYEHAIPTMPKIFISQLEVDALSQENAALIKSIVKDTKDPLSDRNKVILARLAQDGKLDTTTYQDDVVESLASCFVRPWDIPKKSDIERINQESQYAAWTLLHGNGVNHFTGFINEQQVPELDNIEKTVTALQKMGVPLKKEIEGAPGSILRQTSTEAVMIPVEMRDDQGKVIQSEWTYAYYELAERGYETDAHGKKHLFSGFLGPQATQLFDMTDKTKSQG